MDINRAALLDELVKIGEAQEASSGSSERRSDALKRGLKVALKSGLGYGAGMGVGELIGRLAVLQPAQRRTRQGR
jgi:hypothetical protein